MSNVNRKFTLAARPVGYPKLSDFDIVTEPIPNPQDGEVLVRTNYLSVDPYMRGRMNDRASYAPNVQIGEAMVGTVVGEVVASKSPDFQVGDIATGGLGWQEYGVSDGGNLRKVDPTFAPISTALGILGMPGLTAYFGLLDVGKPKHGDTVLISGAAGATGSVAGQIAKLKGCRVIGIAGGPEKCNWLTETAKFDAAIDYKNENVGERLTALCPDGVDVYFDNVGGEILDEVLMHLALNARIIVCGAISQYNNPDDMYGVKNYVSLIIRRATAQGFLILDYLDRAVEGLLCLNKWIEDGKIIQEIDMQHGFDNIPKTLTRLFTGENLGKQLLKVTDPPLPIRSNAIEKTVFRLLSAYMVWRKG